MPNILLKMNQVIVGAIEIFKSRSLGIYALFREFMIQVKSAESKKQS